MSCAVDNEEMTKHICTCTHDGQWAIQNSVADELKSRVHGVAMQYVRARARRLANGPKANVVQIDDGHQSTDAATGRAIVHRRETAERPRGAKRRNRLSRKCAVGCRIVPKTENDRPTAAFRTRLEQGRIKLVGGLGPT
jgi:hypothetical protein